MLHSSVRLTGGRIISSRLLKQAAYSTRELLGKRDLCLTGRKPIIKNGSDATLDCDVVLRVNKTQSVKLKTGLVSDLMAGLGWSYQVTDTELRLSIAKV